MLITWQRICAGFRSTALLVLCTFISPYGRLPPRPLPREEEEADVWSGKGAPEVQKVGEDWLESLERAPLAERLIAEEKIVGEEEAGNCFGLRSLDSLAAEDVRNAEGVEDFLALSAARFCLCIYDNFLMTSSTTNQLTTSCATNTRAAARFACWFVLFQLE